MGTRVKAEEAQKDIRSGMDDRALMNKYELSPKGLQSLFEKLVAQGFLDRTEIEDRSMGRAVTGPTRYRCPSCGLIEYEPFDECPKCGIVVSKVSIVKEADSAAPYHHEIAVDSAVKRAMEQVKLLDEKDPGVIKVVETLQELDKKESETPQAEFDEGIKGLFVGAGVVVVGALLAYGKVFGLIGAAIPVAAGLLAYMRGCWLVARGKGYTGREGVSLGLLLVVGPFFLLLLPNRRSVESGAAVAIFFLVFLALVVMSTVMVVAMLTDKFIF